ncbi:AsmA-like C-terminal region-containing protein [Mesorhizobium marinum]|uniref:AsmA-like C-terminal region-containing protein n=1 Tax=Mesorhizobium marinum TaxID=3228790 RepID=UPI003465C6A7
MEHETPPHEKIRFRRNEITDLARFPSAEPGARPARQWLPKRFGRMLLRVAAGTAVLIAVVLLAVYALGVSGIGSERLRVAAEKAIEEAAGFDVDASVGPARFAFDGIRLLAIDVREVRLRRADDGKAIADVGKIRLGVRLAPLLSGDVRISTVGLSDARIMLAAIRNGADTDWAAALRNGVGLIEPDLVTSAVFASAHHALDAMGSKSLRRLALENVELVLPAGDGVASINVVDARLAESRGDSLTFSATLDLGGRMIEATASARRDRTSSLISGLEISATSPAVETASSTATRIGAVDLTLNGAETDGAEPPRLSASLKLAESALDLERRGVLSGNIDLDVHFVSGSDRIEIDKLRAQIGRSVLDFRGRIGPRPPTGEPGDQPGYRFNLVSTRSTIAPEGSPEPAMVTALQLTGAYQTVDKVLSLDDIIVKGGRGEALGTASMRFVEGQAPGLSVAFNVHEMSVSQVKQLWPWFAGRGARNWVLNNVFGGRVTDAQLQYRVEPGRPSGAELPLRANESFGTFNLTGTRFDTAGLIPPVRDATGAVNYRGNDVDITLSSGTVYLPSGRTVAASNGILSVKEANVQPVIGALDIDVAGTAPAVAELASYDPINAMRHVGLVADDFTVGEVSGNVKADIPLQKGVDRDRLNWLVSLNYNGLSIAKPVDGQMVSEAEGTIVVEKTKAVIAATAKLSGVPARIDAVEPLGDGDAERKRLITLTLDAKAREAVAPGLAGLVDGPIEVKVDAIGGGKRMVDADLTSAQLNIPWAGWSKGPGIAGRVSFQIENAGDVATLSDFNLSGASFGIAGSAVLSKGSLSEASFSSVKLNRGDDVVVAVKQSGNGYRIDIKGKSLDARSVIRQLTADADTAAKAADGGSVSVTVDVDRVSGFHDEKLDGFKLDYRGTGEKVDRLAVDAATSSGAKVELRNGSGEGGRRTMRMASSDAGAVLRFLDIYPHMQGGRIDLALDGAANGPMTGKVDARDFVLVNEPRLGSIVSTTPPGGDRSLNQAVKRDIDTSRVNFERLYSQIEKGAGYLSLSNGILRGPLVGASFQGMLYDKQGNMDMTGTFMPAYGLNRIFGEIPIIGVLLGNGRDRGLIGVTFKLAGDADAPAIQINPLSVIAPGIFRSIFEFR